MVKLSPAAQAVAKAALYVSSCDPEDYPNQAQEIAAAALRAAADQVVPEAKYFMESPCQVVFGARDAEIRRELLAIATELEAQ